jgi:uracil-DNA glycosylase
MEFFELIPPPWQRILQNERALLAKISKVITGERINPERSMIFSALQIPPERVKVVIVGQDPYPASQNATGLAFSIPPFLTEFPPTLRNILKEYSSDLGYPVPMSGDLTMWQQEVLLLNPILTCRTGESLSHAGIGWELFTRSLLTSLENSKLVGIMWGKRAQGVSRVFSPSMSITSSHPSPLSAHRGFFGSRLFSRTNEMLIGAGISPINWRL